MAEIAIVKGKAEHVGDACIGSKWNVDMTSGCACRYLGGKCTYCYGSRINFHMDGGPNFVKTYNREKIRKFIRKNNVQYIRFGKFTEPGAKWTMDILRDMINLCVEENVRPIIVTKILKFDKNLAELLIKSHGIIHYSLGDDKCEPGACFVNTNKQRIEECAKYNNAGAKAIVRVVMDATVKPTEKSLYNKAKAAGIKILLTPIRCQKKTELEKWTGKSFKDAKENYAHFEGYFRPKTIHKTFKNDLICGELSDGKLFCGKCGL